MFSRLPKISLFHSGRNYYSVLTGSRKAKACQNYPGKSGRAFGTVARSRPLLTPIMDSFTMSKEEVFHYIESTLGIENPRRKIHLDRLGLLSEIVLKTYLKIPYQNISNIYGLPPSKRHILSWDEIQDSMLCGRGGTCYELNVFTNRLLTALGYDVTLIGALFLIHEDAHIANVVRDVQFKGQRHLVDVGFGDPTFTPIPLNFDKESPVYQESFLTYKFARTPQGKIMRLHAPLDGQEISTEYKEWFDGWWRRSEFDPELGRDLEHFSVTQMHWYLATASRVYRHMKDVMYAQVYPDGKLVYFANHKYCLELEGRRLQMTRTTSPEELVAAYDKYLPMIPRDHVVACIKNMNLKFPKEDDASKLCTVIPISNHEELIAATKPKLEMLQLQ